MSCRDGRDNPGSWFGSLDRGKALMVAGHEVTQDLIGSHTAGTPFRHDVVRRVQNVG